MTKSETSEVSCKSIDAYGNNFVNRCTAMNLWTCSVQFAHVALPCWSVKAAHMQFRWYCTCTCTCTSTHTLAHRLTADNSSCAAHWKMCLTKWSILCIGSFSPVCCAKYFRPSLVVFSSRVSKPSMALKYIFADGVSCFPVISQDLMRYSKKLSPGAPKVTCAEGSGHTNTMSPWKCHSWQWTWQYRTLVSWFKQFWMHCGQCRT